MTHYFTLAQVLRVAAKHPFYSSQSQYPPLQGEISQIACDESVVPKDLDQCSLLQKPHLYAVILRLLSEENAANDFRNDSYISMTGGGSGSKPLIFLTDNCENRRQRSLMGRLIKDTGIVKPGDWVATVHTAGNMYRALDLTSEILENAGASVLSLAHYLEQSDIFHYLTSYKANALCGDSTQILLFARYVESLDPATKSVLAIEKIIYTSEPLILSQRRYLTAVFGPIQIHSFLASAETGPWTVASLSLTGDPDADYADFIYDTRSMVVEIIRAPTDINGAAQTQDHLRGKHASLHEKGRVVLTSLARLRNPLIRYDTGDVGSIHELPSQAAEKLPPDLVPFLKIYRIYGRDQSSSFSFMAEYFDMAEVVKLFSNAEIPIIQWQLVYTPADGAHLDNLEIRLLSSLSIAQAESRELYVQTLRSFFRWEPSFERCFSVKFVGDFSEFVRSTTGNKVIRLVRTERPKD